jgi:hypothetical protein
MSLRTLITRARLETRLPHFRRPLHEESIEYRAMIEKDFPYEIIERDARHTIEAAFKIVARNAV